MINAGPFLQDSVAVVNIFKLNTENELNWNISQPINTWEGIIHSGDPLDRIKSVDIKNKNIQELPDEIQNLDALDSLILDHNKLIFEELEKISQPFPNRFSYNKQDTVGQKSLYKYQNNPFIISLPDQINSDNNIYQWYKDNNPITENGNKKELTVEQLGTYFCKITNNTFPELTLISANQYVVDPLLFEKDSTELARLYNKNIDNTLKWNLNALITTWEGITFFNGRVNKIDASNSSLDTIPYTFFNLDQIDTLYIQNNKLTFESLENIT
ncbi:immunoglobulin domain-containing protein, partial [Flammeovirga sp. OC4]|uniref:immunoglobulin domain-containing protein n=1 Tax=Flammeovirga sp. OC4 TaxID=1382345 RepID=UPI0005C5899B